MLLGCSSERLAQYHYKKALKHGLKVIQDSDTITINTIDSIPVIINDTIVWEKYFTTKDTVVKFNNIYIPKTRWQTRIEYRYKTKVLKQDVLKYKYIYKDSKQRAKEKRGINWQLFFWGVLTGAILLVVISFVWRMFIKKALYL
jgi:hypothetical protein